MSKKRWTKAEDLMAELEKDPDYLRRRAERDEKFSRLKEKYARLERPILEILASHGYQAESIDDALKRFAPLPKPVVEVFLGGLETCDDDRIRESLVRALGAAERPFDGRPLVRVYEDTPDDNLRWAIANTIALVRPHSIDEWLAQAVADPVLGKTLKTLGFMQ
jgi:hypothetical protein